jgi:hypothetical protein
MKAEDEGVPVRASIPMMTQIQKRRSVITIIVVEVQAKASMLLQRMILKRINIRLLNEDTVAVVMESTQLHQLPKVEVVVRILRELMKPKTMKADVEAAADGLVVSVVVNAPKTNEELIGVIEVAVRLQHQEYKEKTRKSIEPKRKTILSTNVKVLRVSPAWRSPKKSSMKQKQPRPSKGLPDFHMVT